MFDKKLKFPTFEEAEKKAKEMHRLYGYYPTIFRENKIFVIIKPVRLINIGGRR